MEFSGPVFLIFSLVFFMSPVFSYLVSCTRQASLCWVCLWHKTCWIIWFQLINGVSPEKGINELWPLPAACLECAAASQLSGCRLIVSQGSRYCIYVYVHIYCIYCIRETIKPRIAWWQKNKYHYKYAVNDGFLFSCVFQFLMFHLITKPAQSCVLEMPVFSFLFIQ